MSAITAKASRKMKKYAVLTREPRCFLGSFDFSWEQRKLGELALFNPKDELPQTFEYVDLESVVGTEMLSHRTEVKSSAPSRAQRLAHTGDLFYQTVRPYQKNNYLFEKPDNNYVFSTGYAQMRPYVDGYFLLSLVQSERFVKVVLDNCTGTSYPAINANDLAEIEVAAPSDESEAQKIGTIFRSIDNLITLHQRKCANLCSPSQVVFSLLFVTSTFSWEQRKVSDLAEKTYGGGTPTTSNEAYWNGDIPWIQSSDVVDGKLLGVEPRKWITQDGLNNSAAQLIPGNSIAIITRVGVGKLAFMPYSYATSQDFLSLSKLNAEPLFTVYACYKKLQSELNAVQGTSIKGITKDELLAKNIMVPRYAEQQQIGAFFKQLDNLITLHQRECISFTERADRLILTANKKRTTSSWEQRKLGELVDRVVRKNTNNESTLPLTISAQYGLVDQITYFNNRVASRDVSNYYLVLNGEFAYNKSTSDGYPFGAVKRLDLYEKGVLSTLYIVFAPKKEQQIDSDYLTVFFDTDRWHKGVAERAAEGARNHGLLNISAEDFFDIDLSVPKDIVEQKQIGAFIRQLDNLITLHQRKPFLMKWRTSDANRNQTNRLVL